MGIIPITCPLIPDNFSTISSAERQVNLLANLGYLTYIQSITDLKFQLLKVWYNGLMLQKIKVMYYLFVLKLFKP